MKTELTPEQIQALPERPRLRSGRNEGGSGDAHSLNPGGRTPDYIMPSRWGPYEKIAIADSFMMILGENGQWLASGGNYNLEKDMRQVRIHGDDGMLWSVKSTEWFPMSMSLFEVQNAVHEMLLRPVATSHRLS